MSDIQGRVALVTGGASGVGLSMARTFLGRGASVMLADRDAEGLARAVEALSKDSNAVSSVVCDVADAGALEEAAQKTVDHFGKVHIVANNAGVGLGGQPGEIPLPDWRWAALLAGQFLVCRWPPLGARQGLRLAGGLISSCWALAAGRSKPGGLTVFV